MMMKTKMVMLGLAVSAMTMTACTSCEDDNNDTVEVSNTTKVTELLKSIETGAQEPVAYINAESYTQHNLGVADGLAGFGAALGALADYPEAAKVNTVRVFEDGDYVVAHTDYNFFGPKVGFDVFRFENGLIVEHWDNLMVKPTEANPSGHTPLDGATEIKDLDKTEANKALVAQFIKDVLMGKNPDATTSYFDGNNYIQHNTAIGDGLDGLGAALAEMAKNGITMKYDITHKVLGQGNFVLAISEGEFAGNHTSFYDLFRVENGKIAEHWDVIETIAAEDTWKNQNGKFNFK